MISDYCDCICVLKTESIINNNDISGNYITATFETGYVFFSYYALLIDESDTGYPMIIDEVWFTDYVNSPCLIKLELPSTSSMILSIDMICSSL